MKLFRSSVPPPQQLADGGALPPEAQVVEASEAAMRSTSDDPGANTWALKTRAAFLACHELMGQVCARSEKRHMMKAIWP